MKKTTVTMTKGVSMFALAMLITGSIDSIRNMPTAALFGSQLVFFFIVGAILFLLPVGLVSAELVSTKDLPGGIYGWVKTAFGKGVGLLAIWLQWINTMVWYPTILSFIAGTIAFVIDPALAKNKLYLVGVILSVFWLLTLLNLRGIKTSAKFAEVCALIGMVIPVGIIILLGIIWVAKGHHMNVDLSPAALVPHFGKGDSWISLTAIVTAFLGMELATVHVKDVENPQKTFPRALLFSIIFILITMVLGSLAIAIVMPSSQINLVDGVMQAFGNFLQEYHLHWLLPVLGVMLIIGSVGGMINWIISPAKGLLQAGQDQFLPKILCKVNKHGVAGNLLITQAIIVTFVCLAFLLMPTVNASYWLLTDLSTQLYVMMYVLMFIAAIALKLKSKAGHASFHVPGGKNGMWVWCFLGIIGCLITLVVGFIPPSSIDVGGGLHYQLVFASGIIIMLLPVLGLYAIQKYRNK